MVAPLLIQATEHNLTGPLLDLVTAVSQVQRHAQMIAGGLGPCDAVPPAPGAFQAACESGAGDHAGGVLIASGEQPGWPAGRIASRIGVLAGPAPGL